MLKDYITVEELAEVLEIDKISAVEVLDGIIQLEADELLTLAEHIGVMVDNLLK